MTSAPCSDLPGNSPAFPSRIEESAESAFSYEALLLRNGCYAPLAAVPTFSFSRFSRWLSGSIRLKCRVAAFFAVPLDPKKTFRPAAVYPPKATRRAESFFLYAVLADDAFGLLRVARAEVMGSYASFTPLLPEMHLFEREIYEKYGLAPEGHPWLKPVRFTNRAGPAIGDMEFYRVDGDEVHEVGVGPVHAGVIECGHFRFQCLGEEVLHLEISLGYHHRGVESLLAKGVNSRALPLMETVAGDSTVAHSWAYCSLVEALAGAPPSPRGQIIRALALELERLACHTGDLGALAGDVGFLPAMSFCGRLRGDWLNMSALLCGSRFGRGLLIPGGTAFDLDAVLLRELRKRCALTIKDVEGATRLVWASPSVTARMTGIGVLPTLVGASLGVVGLVGRASGLARDARHSHPLPGLPAPPALCLAQAGDVRARAFVRQAEVTASAAFCKRILDIFLGGKEEGKSVNGGYATSPPLAPDSIAVALTESWRGEVCHTAITDRQGGFAAYTLVDPSFHNWAGLAYVLRGQKLSDFPLCNKSFNLSYCGHDL